LTVSEKNAALHDLLFWAKKAWFRSAEGKARIFPLNGGFYSFVFEIFETLLVQKKEKS